MRCRALLGMAGIPLAALPARVVWPGEGSAVGVAEPSLTADERRLYSCVPFRNPAGSYDLDIACTERLQGKDAPPPRKPERRP